MALNPYQQTMLAEMGIPIWQQRHAISNNDENPVASSSLSGGEETQCLKPYVIVLDSLTLDEMGERLLNAILKAINLSLADVALVSAAECGGLASQVKKLKLILVFAEQAPIFIGEIEKSVLRLPTLNHLIIEPAQKKRVWQQLQSYLALAS